MGSVLSSCCGEDAQSDNGDISERTRLISDQSIQQTQIPEGLHNESGLMPPYSASLPKATDEQSALTRILHDTATNIIDISAIEHMGGLEHHDYVDRAAHYGKKLSAVGGGIVAKNTRTVDKRLGLVEVGGASLEKILAGDPCTVQDMALVNEIASRMEVAMGDVRVEHQEDLVVPFGIN